MTDPSQEEIIRGTLERVTFQNPENGFAILQVAVADKRERVTVVGNCLEPRVGSEMVIRGKFTTHPKFGLQLTASSITETPPSSPDGLQRYLSSGIIKGIGEKTAERIVEKFGEQTLEIIHRSPDQIAKIPGVGSSKAKALSDALANQQGMGATLQFLVENKVSPHLAAKIYERFRNKSVETLSKDPYILARTIRGIGFTTADTIAQNLGLRMDSPQRLKAGLFYALEKASDDGHCYLTERELREKAQQLLGLDATISLEDALYELIKEEFIIEYRSMYFLTQIFKAENFVADFIKERLEPFSSPSVPDSFVPTALNNAQTQLGVEFSPEQREAVKRATQYPLLLITGGPGCGKTTIIKAISRVFADAGRRLVLAAPTGKASQRMSQVCDMPASTIHRLLKFDPSTGGFLHSINNPLIADAIIVDEASMIDVMLAKDLFAAISPETTLILVGDKDQLPSVGPGRVFADLLSIREIPSVVLTQLFRRSSESSITDVAHAVNSGMVPQIPEPGEAKSDVYFIPRKNPEEAVTLIEKLLAEQLPQKFNLDPSEITVLTPANRGPLGTIALNTALQAKINPPVDPDLELVHNNQIFRLGDRVCQRVNNYNIDAYGVFNGDTGVITTVNRKDKIIEVELWDGRIITYESGELNQLSLAYAITVHRSQGAEMPCVVLALDNSHYTLLERQLLYTAITRAKKLLVVVGSRQALSMAAKRATAEKRRTYIRERIIGE